MRYMWHATPYENLVGILDDGIKAGNPRLVYLCENGIDAAKFIVVRGVKKILLLKVKIYKSDENKIVETFDHSESYFKCRAFGYRGNIPVAKIKEYRCIDLT